MKTGTLIANLATKLGIDTTAPEFAGILAIGTDIPDAIANNIETNLLTLDSAKSNPTLKSHYFAQALNGVDTELETTAKALGVDDDTMTILKAEKSTPKRAALLATKIKELEIKKNEATGKTDKTELQKKINELQTQLSQTVEANNKAITDIKTQHELALLDYDVLNNLAGYNFSLPPDMPSEVKVGTAKSVINNALSAEGVKVVKVNGKLELQKADGTEYFDSTHKKVNYNDFVKRTLDTNKLLAVTTPTKQGEQRNTRIEANDKTKVNTALLDRVKAARESIAIPAQV